MYIYICTYIYIYLIIHMCISSYVNASGRIAWGPLAPKSSQGITPNEIHFGKSIACSCTCIRPIGAWSSPQGPHGVRIEGKEGM